MLAENGCLEARPDWIITDKHVPSTLEIDIALAARWDAVANITGSVPLRLRCNHVEQTMGYFRQRPVKRGSSKRPQSARIVA